MQKDHRTSTEFDIQDWLMAFILDRKIRHVSNGTLGFYQQKLGPFVKWCENEGLNDILDITPHRLRLFFFWLEEKGHNPGGCHCFFRAVKTFLFFFEEEAEPEGWKNPIKKIAAPKIPDKPIDPVPIEDVSKLIATCENNTFYGSRDKALFLTLLDTGVRASELLDINLEDVNLIEGSIQIRRGKGGRNRVVLIGSKAKRAIRLMLRKRSHNAVALFTTLEGSRLKYSGLRQILRRRSLKANVIGASLHDFRRAFCLAQLQAGVPETSIARFMGHSDTSLIATYARQTTRNLLEVYHSVSDAEL